MSFSGNVAFVDIEADNLLYDATTIWCIVSKINGQYHIYLKHQVEGISNKHTYYYNIQEYIGQVLYKVGRLVFHNGVSYDLPLLAKLHNFRYNISPKDITDTHILSRLYFPDREGHSLGWWGEKLRLKKGDFSDFSHLSLEMIEYCQRDVDVLERVYHALEEEAKGWDWSESTKLEYEIWNIQMEQEQHGVLFDVEKAEELLQKISEEVSSIESTVIEQIPMSYKDEGEVKKVFNKDGSYTLSVKNWLTVEELT